MVRLAPSSWNYWRPLYTGRAWQASFLLGGPIILLSVLLGSQWLSALGMASAGVAMLLAIRSQRDAYATPSVIHHRPGLLGLKAEEIPMRDLDEIFVDPVALLPGMGSLTLKCGSRYLTFECVPEVEQAHAMLLELRDAARAGGRKENHPGMQVSQNNQMQRTSGAPPASPRAARR